jgi:hypothetical protein
VRAGLDRGEARAYLIEEREGEMALRRAEILEPSLGRLLAVPFVHWYRIKETTPCSGSTRLTPITTVKHLRHFYLSGDGSKPSIDEVQDLEAVPQRS